MDKRVLRRSVRQRLAKMTLEAKLAKSARLAGVLAGHAMLRSARVIALYSPLPDEPQIAELIEYFAKEHSVVLPRIDGDIMNFYLYRPAAMLAGAYGILEPVGDVPVAPEDIDVMVVPGVAFTERGERLGRGKGYYDKYMSQKGFRARKIGACYTEQLCVSLPCEGHDVFLDEVVYC